MLSVSGIVSGPLGPSAGHVVRAHRRDTGAVLGSDVTSDGEPLLGDEHYDDLSFLFNFEKHSTIVDSGPGEHDYVLNAGAGLVEGGLSPGGSGLTVPANSGLALNGAFTMEMEFTCHVFSPAYATLFNIGRYDTGALFRVRSNMIETYIVGSGVTAYVTVDAGVRHHIAWSRTIDGTVYVGLDGVIIGSWVMSGNVPELDGLFGVSAHISGEYLNGVIHVARLLKGTARYTTDYTPPTRYPETADDTPTTPGAYRIETTYTGEIQVVCQDDAAGSLEGDKIHRTFAV